MQEVNDNANLSPDMLMEIIKFQTEVVKLGLDLSSIVNFVAKGVQHLTGAGGAIVELAEDDEMVYRASTGIAESLLGLRLKRSSSLSGLCVNSGKLLYCKDSETDSRVDKNACRRVGLRSMVVAPLFHKGSVVGVLKIASPTPSFFTEQHGHILKMMTELIASAMFYSEKYEANELYYQATHDMLTGLANRALFYDRLRQSLALAHRRSSSIGILNLDMDGLKTINDQYGHRAGDAAIREIATRTNRVSRQADTVARLGGDEFGVILSEVQDRNSALIVADKISKELGQPFHFENTSLKIDASIGMAIFPEDAQELDELIEKADQSMYQMKRTRKGRLAPSS